MNGRVGDVTCDEEEVIRLEPILPDVYYQKKTLIPMYAIEIKREVANDIVQLVKSYVTKQIQNNYRHLRNCRKSYNNNNDKNNNDKNNDVDILIGFSKVLPVDLLKSIKKITRTDNVLIKEVKVSKYAPVTRQQYMEWSKMWPLYFKPLRYNNSFHLTEEEMKKAIHFLYVANQIGKKYGTCHSGCVLTFKDTIIASSGDNTKEHPLQHAAMLAIEEATHKLRELLHLKELLRKKLRCKKEHKGEVKEEHKGETLKENVNQIELRFEDTVKKKKAERTEEEEETRSDDICEIERQIKMFEPLTPQQYLCTNYCAYLSHEPCFMCAMALLHSRVKSVIFDKENKESGALFSKTKLHLMKNLNHHYTVYKAVRKKKAV